MYDEEKPFRKILTVNQAKLKAESYCAYQERSQQEVRDKLYTWGLHQADVENIICDLIAENFLNEERFALAYTSGKFKLKGWGKIKIGQGLKLKRVSPNLIKIALATIDYDDYIQKLQEILDKKESLLKEKDPYIRKNKLMQHALSKGYESSEILILLKTK